MFSAQKNAAPSSSLFVEDVFSTWLYTGNGSTQTITNGIDLAGKGGLVWSKNRSFSADHLLYDTSRGTNKRLATNTTNGTGFEANQLNSFNSNGFTLGGDGALNAPNRNAEPYVSWTFREAPKFFDVVTYTGTGVARTIAHNLGITPGCIIVKRTDTTSNWVVYHRSQGTGGASFLNTTTGTSVVGASVWNSTAPTATEFSVGSYADTNASGGTFVAYLFAHDTATAGVIQCGSYIGNGSTSGPTVTLGWEPQWLLVCGTGTVNGNNQATSGNWQLIDNMRNMPVGSADATLQPNLSNAETSVDYVSPTATGFQIVSSDNQVNQALSGTGNPVQYNYIAIRRAPMRIPTLGTSVFAPVAFTSATPYAVTTNFPLDMIISSFRNITTGHDTLTRLTGDRNYLQTPFSSAEAVGGAQLINFANNTGYTNSLNYSGTYNTIDYAFRRAPSFVDVVCYTGTGSVQNVKHNLGVVPELMIVKNRANVTYGDWMVYHKDVGVSGFFYLNLNSAVGSTSSWWNQTNPTSTQFTTSNGSPQSNNGITFVAYLFASCPGVSKVGSYTGTGALQTVNCGFTTGARFVLIKRTDSTGDWFVWDSARGITSGNDPYLVLNSTAAEVTGTNYVDTDTTGFKVTAAAPAALNASGGTYIFLAVA